MKKVFLFLLSFLFILSFTFAEREIPKYHNFVNDYADIFTDVEEGILNEKLSKLEKESLSEVVILTINELGFDSLEEYSLEVARSWGIGKKEIDNGLLLLIVKDDRKIRIEVGYGLEGTITDANTFWLIDDILKPNFRQEKFFQGANKTIDKISGAILNDEILPKKISKKNKFEFVETLIWFLFPLLFFLDFFIIWVVKFFGKTKTWIPGGFVGASIGFGLAYFFTTIVVAGIIAVILMILGFVFDYFISKWYTKLTEKQRQEWEESIKNKITRSGNRSATGFGSGSSGGFGGFGGGGFGGGGGSGGW